MTEKRFRVEKQTFDGYCIVDNHFDGYYAYEKQDLEKLCETLNDLSDENDELKSKNRGLQSELQIFKEDVTHSNLQINKLADENEQLKSIIDKLTLDNTKMKKVLNTTKKECEDFKELQRND